MKTQHPAGNQDNDTKIEETSPELNKKMAEPPTDTKGFSPEEKAFVDLIFSLVENKTIELHTPSSLINTEIYEKSNDQKKGMADQTAVNFLSKIRELLDLREISGQEKNFIKATYQAKYLVSMLKYRKEEFEKQYGDMFII